MNPESAVYDGSSEAETEGASETDAGKVEEDVKDFSSPMQLLKDKVQQYRKELQDLNAGSHAEYQRRVTKLERAHDESVRTIECWRDFMTLEIDSEYRGELEAAEKEYETKRANLKDMLTADLADKKKVIETERQTMELTGDSTEVKPIVTRKLRKRMQDVVPQAEKRRRPASNIALNCALDEDDVMADLLRVYKGKLPVSLRPPQAQAAQGAHTTSATSSNTLSDQGVEVKLQDGKLFYDKKVFIRGQPVFLDQKDGTRISGTVQSIGQNEVWVRKTSGDQGRIKVPIQALLRGKYSVRKRST
ncbi:sin3 histone deacetylase corepressor complex component SDS3-like [Sycon ciliatum]|uniref:sin3 histone deacetylase corepressor complex component SDS3-like n=1 Tax=Sycon ciliatum TaxID=27933 RepID=UPI0020A98630|eukprot:scpid80800/ scgid1287/ Sin3 histone deacetylase corepressor complex component SDS3; Suppressor of defective silencing 3 protein homolog